MFRKIIIASILFLLFIIPNTHACDVCGCGAGSNFVGLSPEYQGKIIGLRYRQNALNTERSSDGSHTYMTNDELYKTLDLYGSYILNERWNFGITIPYIIMSRKNTVNSAQKNGIGDIFINANRRILERKSNLNKYRLMQQAWIGIGLKLPIGKYQAMASSDNKLNLFQLGSGSWDYLFTGMYDIRIQDFGLNNALQYKLNTANKDGYRYGNRFTSTHQFYYKWRTSDKMLFTPNAGIQYEYANYDNDRNFVQDRTGGNILLSTLGLEFNYSNIAIGTNVQLPLKQHLAYNTAYNQYRFMLHLSYVW